MIHARTDGEGAARPRPRRTADAAARPAVQALRSGHGVPGIAPVEVPVEVPVQHQRLLRALVERFGGEVTASTLTRYLSDGVDGISPAAGPQVGKSLRHLQDLGAVDLEPTDGRDLIVRLLPPGAALYH